MTNMVRHGWQQINRFLKLVVKVSYQTHMYVRTSFYRDYASKYSGNTWFRTKKQILAISLYKVDID
jgi:hypothetical protein